MLNEIINQGFLEVGLNTFLETMLPQRPFRGRTLAVNIVAALISYFFLKNCYKGSLGVFTKTSDKLKKLAPILLVLDLFLLSSYGLSLEVYSHLVFIFTFVFLTCFFKNIFTFCEVFLMADMHARFLEIYLEGYHVDSSLVKISNLLVISHCMNILLYLFMHIIKPSKLHGLSAFGISVALILGINGFNIFLMIKELFSETAWLNTLSLWVCVLFAGVPIIFWLQKKQLVRNIIIRKFFHFQTVIMFSFGIIYTPLLMKVAFSVAIFLFISLEALRISLRDHFPFVLTYESFVKTFIDERDNERLIYTHIFLLLGCAYPFLLDWKSYNNELKSLLTKLAGVLILGVGDSMAAIIGSKYGRLKKFIHPKSYEGLVAGIISMLLFILAVIFVYFPVEFGDMRKLIMIIIATVIVGLLEAVTKQNDNLALPITYYNLLMALL